MGVWGGGGDGTGRGGDGMLASFQALLKTSVGRKCLYDITGHMTTCRRFGNDCFATFTAHSTRMWPFSLEPQMLD